MAPRGYGIPKGLKWIEDCPLEQASLPRNEKAYGRQDCDIDDYQELCHYEL